MCGSDNVSIYIIHPYVIYHITLCDLSICYGKKCYDIEEIQLKYNEHVIIIVIY